MVPFKAAGGVLFSECCCLRSSTGLTLSTRIEDADALLGADSPQHTIERQAAIHRCAICELRPDPLKTTAHGSEGAGLEPSISGGGLRRTTIVLLPGGGGKRPSGSDASGTAQRPDRSIEVFEWSGEMGTLLLQLIEYRGEISHQGILAGANRGQGFSIRFIMALPTHRTAIVKTTTRKPII
jgi:hypothetical protein